jgi:CTP:molybdopterin cytidylyltransferase MocA
MKNTAGIAGLIPAAGYSSRMGMLKPLLRLGEVTAIEGAVNCFLEAGIDNVTVVLGHRADEIIPVLKNPRVKWIINRDYPVGMLSSILTGIRSLEPEVEAFFMLPGDIPLVKPETILALIDAYRHCRAPVIYPVFRGFRGHPPLISLNCVQDLTSAHEGGLKTFLLRYKAQAVEVEVVDEGVLMDCDTPADYRLLQGWVARETVLTANVENCSEG